MLGNVREMKVLFVSHESGKNGSSISMLTLVQILQDIYKWEIEVLLPYPSTMEKALKARDIAYISLFYYPDFRTIGKKIKWKEIIKETVNFLAVQKLKRRLKEKKYDYIISNSSAVDIGARAAKELNIKHVYYIREFMEEDFGFEYRKKIRMKKLLETSTKVVFISQAIAKKYTLLYKLKSYKVIYNGVSKDDYYIERHEILEQSTLKMIQIGTLCEAKGTKESVEFIESARRIVDCHLTLVGNSSEDYLEDLNTYILQNSLESNVTIIPYMDNILTALEQADILLMNSRSEGFGRVTVEGMISGLLVVGRDAAGTSELISNQKNGLLFRDKQEFCDCIYDIAQNREKYKTIAKYGQQSACKNFQPINMAKEIVRYLDD